MKNRIIYKTENLIQTQKLAEEFAKQIQSGIFIAFYGNLGSGKTTFIQGFAKALGIKKRIISPTFIIIRSYKLTSKNKTYLPTKQAHALQAGKINNFYHIDLYRTQSKNDLLSIGLDDLLKSNDSIIALEWAEKMDDLLPKKRIEIRINNLGEEKREISIEFINC